MLAAALLSIAVQTSPRDVTAHVAAAESLAKRLTQSGFPDLRTYELRRVEFPENTVILDLLEYYAWLDSNEEPRHAYSVYGTRRPVPAKSVSLSVDSFVAHLFASTRFKDGSWYATGLDKALVSFVAAGHIDAVRRVIERDLLDRTPVDAFIVEMLHGIAVPRFNEAVGFYEHGDYATAREVLSPLMGWLTVDEPSVAGRQAEQRAELSRALVDRTFLLAGELRRRLRAEPIKPFDNDVAQSLELEARIAYLIEHLPECNAITSRPGGAWFHTAAVPQALIEIGKPALPSLRSVVESDPRLTTVSYNRVDGQLLYVYSVADVARQVIRKIEEAGGPR